ncbi:hypothetical protein [Streptomyces sp. NPDC056661]|uniref:hypothetical protein n=1 Tax=Streptomyces sp. NPDC056661 TaxID=3345898 RepID=UPI003691C210
MALLFTGAVAVDGSLAGLDSLYRVQLAVVTREYKGLASSSKAVAGPADPRGAWFRWRVCDAEEPDVPVFDVWTDGDAGVVFYFGAVDCLDVAMTGGVFRDLVMGCPPCEELAEELQQGFETSGCLAWMSRHRAEARDL